MSNDLHTGGPTPDPALPYRVALQMAMTLMYAADVSDPMRAIAMMEPHSKSIPDEGYVLGFRKYARHLPECAKSKNVALGCSCGFEGGT